MSIPLYLPTDELTGPGQINYDLATDWLELNAFFSETCSFLTDELANQIDIGVTENHSGLDAEMRYGKEVLVTGTIARIEGREKALGSTYPFELDIRGEELEYVLSDDISQGSYILSLLLSNLRSVSSILASSRLHPSEEEVQRLRRFFQYFATAALAAEIHGCAWSFGSPRLDGSGFLSKLEEIWRVLRDGQVKPQRGVSRSPKDDQIDVFAARPYPDGLPGFLLAVAQVATGKNFKNKSLKGHISVFKGRWFGPQPVTQWIRYMIIPFARPDDQFIDDVLDMGNVLHRLRVPRRVAQAKQLVREGISIEGYDCLQEAVQWLADYRRRAWVAA